MAKCRERGDWIDKLILAVAIEGLLTGEQLSHIWLLLCGSSDRVPEVQNESPANAGNAVQLALNGIFVYCIRHCKH